jgi:hypothetical protein
MSGRIWAQLTSERFPIHMWHLIVHYDEIKLFRSSSKQCQSLCTASSHHRVVPEPIEHLLAYLYRQLFIINTEYTPTMTFLFAIRVTTRDISPAYPKEQQEAAYVTSLSDRG